MRPRGLPSSHNRIRIIVASSSSTLRYTDWRTVCSCEPLSPGAHSSCQRVTLAIFFGEGPGPGGPSAYASAGRGLRTRFGAGASMPFGGGPAGLATSESGSSEAATFVAVDRVRRGRGATAATSSASVGCAALRLVRVGFAGGPTSAATGAGGGRPTPFLVSSVLRRARVFGAGAGSAGAIAVTPFWCGASIGTRLRPRGLGTTTWGSVSAMTSPARLRRGRVGFSGAAGSVTGGSVNAGSVTPGSINAGSTTRRVRRRFTGSAASTTGRGPGAGSTTGSAGALSGAAAAGSGGSATRRRRGRRTRGVTSAAGAA
jgi:hypothetical protein